MKHAGLLEVCILCLLVSISWAQNVPPQTITVLKTYYPDTTLVEGGQARCLVVYPDEDGYAELAEDVAGAIKAATGAEVPLKADKQYTEADRETNLICLGRMNNNKLALDLYIFHYVACDDWFPGPDGFVVRSCCDPWGNGKNVIMLGGTDLAGVKLAVDHFKGMLHKGDTVTIPRTIRTQFKGTGNLEEFAKTIEPYYHENFIDLKALPYGAEYKMVQAAERYFVTGRDEYLKVYAKMMRRWMDEYCKWSPGRQITTPKYIIPVMILSYDQIEESPLLPDDLKLEMTNLLYDYTSRMGVHGRITQLKPGVLATTGHHNVSETVVYGGRYFKNYYPDVDLTRIEKGLASVQTGQETIRNCYGFIDNDGGYTQFYPTTAMKLSLTMDNYDFFASGNARTWMEYCLLISGNWGASFFGSSPSWAIAAWHYQDPTYVWFHDWRNNRSEYYPECKADSLTYWLWTYLPDLEERVPQEMAGVRHLTVHPTNYEQIKRQGSFVNVPRERTFHQLVMREGFERDDQYLRLDGINDGIANGGDGNAIAWITDGRPWLTNTGKWGGGRSMKYHSTCLVLREGQMAGKRVAFCDLQLASELPNSGFARSVMHEYNGLDWARSIAWIKGKYWVVFDQLEVLEPADYSLLCQWMCAGYSVDEEYRATLTQRDHTLYLQAAGGNRPLVTSTEDGRPIVRQALHGQLSEGDDPTFAHLLYGHENAKPHEYSIKRISQSTCLVTEPDRQVLIGVSPLSKPDEPVTLSPEIQVKCTMFALAPDEISLAGLTSFGGEKPMLQTDKPIDLAVDLAQGLVTLKAAEPTKLTLRGLALTEDAVAAADPTATETVQLEAQQYQLQASTDTGPLAAIAGAVRSLVENAAALPPAAVQVQRPECPHKLTERWGFSVPEGDNVRIGTISSGDLDGNGDVEALAGTADGRLFCLDADGKQRWEFAAGGGINDIAVADFGEGPRVLAASDDEHVYCLDAGAKELWKFTAAGIECTNQAPGEFGTGRYIEGDGEMMVIEVADINADGVKEILVGSKTFTHGGRRVFGTLWCLNPAGELQWHLYQSGGTVTSISVFDDAGQGQRKIAFGTGGGTYGRSTYVCDNEGKLITRHGGPYGEKFVQVGRVASDRSYREVRLEHRDGTLNVYEVGDPYELKWAFTAGGLSAVGPVVTDLDGDGIAEVLIGSGGGSIYAISEDGAEQGSEKWRTNLMEPISALAAADVTGDDKPEAVAASQAGGVHVLDGAGQPLAYMACGEAVSSLSAVPGDGKARIAAGTVAGQLLLLALE